MTYIGIFKQSHSLRLITECLNPAMQQYIVLPHTNIKRNQSFLLHCRLFHSLDAVTRRQCLQEKIPQQIAEQLTEIIKYVVEIKKNKVNKKRSQETPKKRLAATLYTYDSVRYL